MRRTHDSDTTPHEVQLTSSGRSNNPLGSAVYERAFDPDQVDTWDFQAHVTAPGEHMVTIDYAGPVARLIDNYNPTSIPPERWAIYAHVARDILHACDFDGPGSVRNNTSLVAAYCDNAYTSGIWDPDRQHYPPLSPTHVEAFCRDVLADHSIRSQGRHRSWLRTIGRRHEPASWPPPDHEYGHTSIVEPYPQHEVGLLWSHATSLTATTGNARYQAVIAVGLAAGPHPHDYRDLWANSIHIVNGVPVADFGAPNPRRIPLHHTWAERALDACHQLDGQLVVGGTNNTREGMMSRAAELFNKRAAVRLNATRLRHTWMVTLLNEGCPIDVLVDAAGIESLKTIERLRPYLDPRPASHTVAWLQGRRP